jgi:hypothetical protein
VVGLRPATAFGVSGGQRSNISRVLVAVATTLSDASVTTPSVNPTRAPVADDIQRGGDRAASAGQIGQSDARNEQQHVTTGFENQTQRLSGAHAAA